MKSRTGRVNSFDDEIPNTGADGTVGERAGAGRAVYVTIRRRPGTVDGGGAAGAGPGRELGRHGPRLRGQRRSAGAGVERSDPALLSLDQAGRAAAAVRSKGQGGAAPLRRGKSAAVEAGSHRSADVPRAGSAGSV